MCFALGHVAAKESSVASLANRCVILHDVPRYCWHALPPTVPSVARKRGGCAAEEAWTFAHGPLVLPWLHHLRSLQGPAPLAVLGILDEEIDFDKGARFPKEVGVLRSLDAYSMRQSGFLGQDVDNAQVTRDEDGHVGLRVKLRSSTEAWRRRETKRPQLTELVDVAERVLEALLLAVDTHTSVVPVGWEGRAGKGPDHW